MRWRGIVRALILAITMVGTAAIADGRGSAPSMRWVTVDTGGGTVNTGGTTLSATLGQSDAGRVTTGALLMQAGFWNRETATNQERIFRDGFE